MRRNNVLDMTIVEQLVAIREDVCEYACKYKEDIDRKYKEDTTRKVMIQQYCHEYPLCHLHYVGNEEIDVQEDV